MFELKVIVFQRAGRQKLIFRHFKGDFLQLFRHTHSFLYLVSIGVLAWVITFNMSENIANHELDVLEDASHASIDMICMDEHHFESTILLNGIFIGLDINIAEHCFVQH